MGYSHSWKFSGNPETKAFATRMKKLNTLVDLIIRQSSVPLCYECDFPHIPPQNAPYGVRFNGVGDDYYETFMFTLYDHEGFCKTDRKPYDIVVTAVLFAMQSVFPKSQFTWDSDGICSGQVDQEVKDGYNLFVIAIGYNGPNLLDFKTTESLRI